MQSYLAVVPGDHFEGNPQPGQINDRLLGIRFADKCSGVHSRLLENKIITGTSSDPNVLRLLPPLCVSLEEVDRFLEQLAGKTNSTSNAG